jgi:hypothetical protein
MSRKLSLDVEIGRLMTFSEKNDVLTIEDILSAFEHYDGKYKLTQVDAAIKQKDAIIPHLISILEQVYAEPDKYIGDSEYYAHIYALMLLGHFKENSAHKVIIDLFSLPNDLPYSIFGDLQTENLPVILIQTCGGSIEDIKRLILNINADEYSRTSAVQALAYAVVEEFTTRDDAISFLKGLFTGNEAEKGSFLYAELASCALNLYPEELMDTLKGAFEKNIIPSFCISFDDIKKGLMIGKEESLNKLRIEFIEKSKDNIHDSMSWWACFNKKTKVKSTNTTTDTIPKRQGGTKIKSPKPPKAKKSFWDL